MSDQDLTGPDQDVPDQDVPDQDVPDQDVPDQDVPDQDGDGSAVEAAVEVASDDDAALEEGDAEASGTEDARISALEREGDVAADYLEELLDIADLDGDLDMDVEADRASVSIVGADLSNLVGSRGEVLDALQELTRLAVYRETGERSRLMLDISGYRAGQRARLVALAEESVAEVKATGERVALQPMSPFERKVIHDAVAEAGLTSESEGVEPRRFVVILPA